MNEVELQLLIRLNLQKKKNTLKQKENTKSTIQLMQTSKSMQNLTTQCYKKKFSIVTWI